MKSNYNDIIDIILTLLEDEELAKSILVSGSIVPYIITNKESNEYHTDFYILVKRKKINEVRNKIKKLIKEFDFDMISDSSKYTSEDYGFKIKYQDTAVGFFPYSLIDNDFTIKTYGINKDKNEINLKSKIIPNVQKSNVIRLINFAGDKKLRIVSPEFILADKEVREKSPGNPTKETMRLLEDISDGETLDLVRKSLINTRIKIKPKEMKESNLILTIILSVLVVMLVIVAYICFKK